MPLNFPNISCFVGFSWNRPNMIAPGNPFQKIKNSSPPTASRIRRIRMQPSDVKLKKIIKAMWVISSKSSMNRVPSLQAMIMTSTATVTVNSAKKQSASWDIRMKRPHLAGRWSLCKHRQSRTGHPKQYRTGYHCINRKNTQSRTG